MYISIFKYFKFSCLEYSFIYKLYSVFTSMFYILGNIKKRKKLWDVHQTSNICL